MFNRWISVPTNCFVLLASRVATKSREKSLAAHSHHGHAEKFNPRAASSGENFAVSHDSLQCSSKSRRQSLHHRPGDTGVLLHGNSKRHKEASNEAQTTPPAASAAPTTLQSSSSGAPLQPRTALQCNLRRRRAALRAAPHHRRRATLHCNSVDGERRFSAAPRAAPHHRRRAALNCTPASMLPCNIGGEQPNLSCVLRCSTGANELRVATTAAPPSRRVAARRGLRYCVTAQACGS